MSVPFTASRTSSIALASQSAFDARAAFAAQRACDVLGVGDDAACTGPGAHEREQRLDLRLHAARAELAGIDVTLRLLDAQDIEPLLIRLAEADGHALDTGRDHEKIRAHLD